jgi:hypothetical protein
VVEDNSGNFWCTHFLSVPLFVKISLKQEVSAYYCRRDRLAKNIRNNVSTTAVTFDQISSMAAPTVSSVSTEAL